MIARYEADMAEMLTTLSAENLNLAVEIAEVPEHIRGFGHVKERHLEAAEAEWDSLMNRFRSGDVTKEAAQ